MFSRLTIITCFLLLFFEQVIVAQEYSWKHYSVSDGLPQTLVNAIDQDSYEYIWIATKGGISQFDEISFKNYTNKDGLSNDHARQFQKDAFGGIYANSTYDINYIKNGVVIPLCLISSHLF